jgi:predicted NUDIX family NTP pyrophosphohydrolase
MPKKSAGLLLYREKRGSLEVFLVHPGGPFWAKKDDGAWSIPKGEFDEDEDPLDAARREFKEETGFAVVGEYLPLTPIRQSGGKTVYAWVVRGDVDAAKAKSNTFSIEWPPGSSKTREFPEIDRADWFDIDVARRKILKSQLPLLDQFKKLSAPRVVQRKTNLR